MRAIAFVEEWSSSAHFLRRHRTRLIVPLRSQFLCKRTALPAEAAAEASAEAFRRHAFRARQFRFLLSAQSARGERRPAPDRSEKFEHDRRAPANRRKAHLLAAAKPGRVRAMRANLCDCAGYMKTGSTMPSVASHGLRSKPPAPILNATLSPVRGLGERARRRSFGATWKYTACSCWYCERRPRPATPRGGSWACAR